MIFLRPKSLFISTVLIISAGSAVAAESKMIRIDGSSTVFPVTEAMAEEFQSAQKGEVKVTVGISGTGGGFKKFCRGETDVQNASRPISAKEMADCSAAKIKYVELPIAFDAMVIVVNPKNQWLKEISVEQLKKMWEPAAQGKIVRWNQVEAQWPDQPLKLYGAGSDSGTFDYFTEAIVGKAKSSRGDYTASEDDNTLVQGVANDVNGLGYIPLSYYEENKAKLKAVGVVPPSAASHGSEKEKAAKKTVNAKAVLANRQTVENGTYSPLSRPLFIYVSESALSKIEVSQFTEFYLKNAASFVPEVKYVSLPQKAYDLALKRLAKKQVGTVFNGKSEVGMKIEELLTKETKL